MPFKPFFALPGRIVKNLYFLTFLNGFLLASLFYLKTEDNYESGLFSSIQKHINKSIDGNDTQDSVVIKIMNACNNLLGNRGTLFTDQTDIAGFKADYMHPATIDLMTARGACGSYSIVLARILQDDHFAVRIAQMKARGIYGAHNVIEVQLPSGWVVLDPTFNVYFTRPDGHLASFADIQHDWSYYSAQLPREYNTNYRYEDVRYTNWGKIPFVFPVVKKILDVAIGKDKANAICLRMFLLRMYNTYFYMVLLLFVPLCLIMLWRMLKTKIFPRYDIPITLANVVKYTRMKSVRLRGN